MSPEWEEIAPETWIWTTGKGLPEIAKVTQTWGDRGVLR
jgi:hypothetical protein